MARFDFGLCRHCHRGRVKRMWGGIKPQFYCTHCGIVTGYGGRRDKSRPIPMESLRDAIDQTFNAINIPRIPLGPFMEALRYTLGNRYPVVSVDELRTFGYDIKDGHLIRSRHDRHGQ